MVFTTWFSTMGWSNLFLLLCLQSSSLKHIEYKPLLHHCYMECFNLKMFKTIWSHWNEFPVVISNESRGSYIVCGRARTCEGEVQRHVSWFFELSLLLSLLALNFTTFVKSNLIASLIYLVQTEKKATFDDVLGKWN